MKVWIASIVLLAACGGDDGGGNGGNAVLLGGNITYTVGSNVYVQGWGVAVPPFDDSAAFAVVISNKAIGCSLQAPGDIPQGEYIIFEPTSLSPMSYSSLLVNAYRANGAGEATSSGNAAVEITTVTETDVSGSISYSSPSSAGDITLNGTFDVTRCF